MGCRWGLTLFLLIFVIICYKTCYWYCIYVFLMFTDFYFVCNKMNFIFFLFQTVDVEDEVVALDVAAVVEAAVKLLWLDICLKNSIIFMQTKYRMPSRLWNLKISVTVCPITICKYKIKFAFTLSERSGDWNCPQWVAHSFFWNYWERIFMLANLRLLLSNFFIGPSIQTAAASACLECEPSFS